MSIMKSRSDDIAIIGMSCRFPGAENYRQFWQNLINKKSSITEIPQDRWDWRRFYGNPAQPGKTYSRWGGFIDDIDKFDAEFFKFSPKESELMDPQHRILLELTWHCLEDAGYRPSSLKGADIGVYIGACNNDYKELQERNNVQFEGYSSSGSGFGGIANRVSFVFDWHGPSYVVDTACSSSMLAVIQAADALRSGACDLAIAGGINYLGAETRGLALSNLHFLSANGHCKAFDKDGDGYVRSEGAGLIFLKPLEDAIKDGDTIVARIKGGAVNHGGKARTYTSPNAFSQSRVIEKAISNSGITSDTISHIEAHGTGTALGDPIEILGLKRAFSKSSSLNRTNFCGIGTSKANIGHPEGAAGIVGLIKTALSLRHKTLIPLQNFETLNPRISLKNSPFYFITDTPKKWRPLYIEKKRVPLRAGVSSFGASGTNGHLIMEESGDRRRKKISSDLGYAFIFSANTSESLNKSLEQFVHFFNEDSEANTLNLEDIAYTLQVGRDMFCVRLAIMADSITQLVEKLNLYLIGKRDVVGIYEGKIPNVESKTESTETDILDAEGLKREWKSLEGRQAILKKWVNGDEVNWDYLYSDKRKQKRVPLPTYSFIKERYWIEPKTPYPKRSFEYLHKTWKPSPMLTKATQADSVLILTSSETSLLAERLLKQMGQGSQIINIGEAFKPDEIVTTGSQFTGCIDVSGCGKKEDRNLDRIPLLQNIIDLKQSGMKLLYVSKGLNTFKAKTANMSGALFSPLYRMLQNEYQHIKSACVDMDPEATDAEIVQWILREYAHLGTEQDVCYRGIDRYVSRLDELPPQKINTQRIKFNENDVILITGGTRGLGYLCASHLVQVRGVKQLILTGRETFPDQKDWDDYVKSNPDTDLAKKIKNIKYLIRLGAKVRVLNTPLDNNERVKSDINQIIKAHGAITGVLHCAGLTDIQNLAFIRKSKESVQRILDPKVDGLNHLSQALEKQPLKFFMAFSSVSAAIPALAAAQSDYAMANGYMDYFCQSKGAPYMSVQWPSWRDSGMKAAYTPAYSESGLGILHNEDGIAFFEELLNVHDISLIFPKLTETKEHSQETEKNETRQVVPSSEKQSISNDNDTTSLELTDSVSAWLKKIIAKEMKIEVEKLQSSAPLTDYGVDSIMSLQITQQIGDALNETINPILLLEIETLDDLTDWVVTQFPHVRSKESVLTV